MYRLFVYSIFLILIAFFFSGMSNRVQAQNRDSNIVTGPEKFRTQLNEVVNSYLRIKDALAKNDVKIASKYAAELVLAVPNVDAGLLNKSKQNDWNQQASLLIENGKKINKNSDLQTQRKALQALSEEVKYIAQNFGPLPVTLYQQYCPMAFGSGGYWLSNSREILNPYLGADMPTCGQVTETIGQSKSN
jgi:Cu(I)/Ag(I) efflux system membrane fusion protein